MKCPGMTRKGRPCKNPKAKGRPTCGRCAGPLAVEAAPVAVAASPQHTDPIAAPPARLMPAALSDYYAAADRKHATGGTGSTFDAHRLHDVITLACAEHGDLSSPAAAARADRTGRARLTDAGATPDAFLPQCRYVVVEGIPGRVGLVASADLDDDVVLTAVETKPGAPRSLVTGADVDRPAVGYATVVLGPPPPDSGVTEPLVVWTAHPGPPVRPAADEMFTEGERVTVAEARRRLGGEFHAQTSG